VNDKFRRIAFIPVLVLAAAATIPCPAGAETGFQATLSDPPRVVSAYDETADRFSAAMYPLSRAVLSRILLYSPTLDSASFEQRYLKFNTHYQQDLHLVPVSVDADQFLNYRTRVMERRNRSELVQKSIQQARAGSRGSGLSIGVALPERFDRIFGEGGGNLRVSGYRRITFSGRSQWTDVANTDNVQQSRFPSLNMEQISAFQITGTIGTKITVKVSQDSQTDIPLANRIQIRYKGDDDDVLKVIEAGNTNLSLPNTRFVGYSSRIQGLFGVKAEAQLGDLRLIGIASQEKGSSERASISATGEENATYIRDYQYVEGRIFDLGYEGEFNPQDSVRSIHVFEHDKRDSIQSVVARLSMDPSVSTGSYDSLRVKEIDGTQYEIRHDARRNLHFIAFNSPRREALALYMEIDRYDDNGFIRRDTIGRMGGEPYDLRYLRALDVDYTPSHPTWSLMWRNCYRIPRGASAEDLNIKVLKALPGREGTSSALDYQAGGTSSRNFYLEILGLDQYNRLGDKTPDNIIDERSLIFEPEWGLVIFPNRTPFASDTVFVDKSGSQSAKLAKPVPTIYYYTSPSEKSEYSEYYIQVSTMARSSVIRLNRANIIEGSERVTLNGQLLQRDSDYKIDYGFGQVTLLTDEATDPNADVDIEFEYAPFLAVQKKTLLGLRAEYEYSNNLRFGSTVLYKSDKAQDRKPRVGQETAQALILDFDASFRLNPSFITSAIDALPLITTEATSTINVSGEIAQSRPNPNVDGVAYIDDFEGSQDRLSLGTTRATWTHSSMPAIDTASWDFQRGKLIWHNVPPIPWDEVYKSETKPGEGALRPLRLIFRPKNVTYTLGPDSVTVDTTYTHSWGGILRYFGSRIDPKRVQLFEVRARGSGVLHFDFGIINEDIDGNRTLNTEDIDGNGSVDKYEDVGLDGVANEKEVDEFGNKYDPLDNPDPKGDNWWFEGDWPPPVPSSRYQDHEQAFRDSVENENSLLHYEWVNGTEANRNDPTALGIPDEEKLGSVFEEDNSYFSFHINLDTLVSDTFLVKDSKNDAGWRTYQIPIWDPLALDTPVVSLYDDGSTAPDPDWARISHVRVWLETDENSSEPVVSEIASWHFVQANWQDSLIIDSANMTDSGLPPKSKFYVASVSDEENVNFKPPEGVEGYYDKVNKITEAQRALALVYEDLQPNDIGLVTRSLVTVERYSGYRRLEMFVHGPDNAGTDSMLFFFRVGRDLSNFYEYHVILDTGWHANNRVDMDFNVATALKDAAQRGQKDAQTPVDTTAGPYRVVGQPNINEARLFAVGVVNLGDSATSGQVWLDELRVTDVRKDVGTAARLNVSGTMADLISYQFSIENKDAYFRGLSSATRGGSNQNLGSGASESKFSSSVTVQLHKFLPRSWNANLPVQFSYNKSTSTPLLRTNSDIVLPEEVRKAEKSLNESRRFSVSESFGYKGRNPLFSVLLNRQKVSFSYTRTFRTSVNNPYSFAENYNARSEYDMGMKTPVGLRVFAWTKWIPILKKTRDSKLYLFPNNWRWTGTFNRSMSITEDQDRNRRSSLRRDFDGRMNMSYKIFDNLTTSLTYSTKRDLSDPDLVRLSLKDPKLGLETNYNQSFKANYDASLVSFISSKLQYTAAYNDNWDRSSESLNSGLSRSWSVGGSFRHLDLLGGSARRGGLTRTVRGGARGAPSEPTEAKGKPFYDPALAVLRFLTGWINPLSYNYSESYKNSVPAMLERPSLGYRFGLSDESDVPRITNSRSPSANEGIGYDLGSGFKLLGGIATDVSFRRNITRDLIKVSGDRLERRSTGWPELGIRISQFTYFPLIKKFLNSFIRIFSPRTGFSRQINEDYNIDGGFVTSRTETIGRNPVLALNFKVLRALSITGSYTLTNALSERFNPTNGKLQSETRSTKKTLAFTSKYSFSSPGGIGIPLLGRLKFKSTMSISVNVQFNADRSETKQVGGNWAVGTDKSKFSVSPDIKYQFSQQIQGGLTGRWEDSNDIKSNRKSHIRELRISAEIRF